MLFTEKNNIADQIISALGQGPSSTLNLLRQIENTTHITKQGFYKSLRQLIQQEIVVKNKQVVLLNPVWVSKLVSYTQGISSSITIQGKQELLELSEGDSMIFRFKSINDLFLLWSYYFYIFCKEDQGPIIFFNSHNFWHLLRSDIEHEIYRWIKVHNRKAYSVIGYKTELDKSSTAFLAHDYGIEIAYEDEPSFRTNEYPIVFGDYILTTYLDDVVAKQIHEVYNLYTQPTQETVAAVQKALMSKNRSRVMIERNKNKAEKIRTKLLNYFIFYKTQRS